MPKLSLPRWVKKNPAMFFGTLLIALLSVGLLVFRITTLHPGPNIYETAALERLNNIADLIKNPLDFVYILTAKLLSFILGDLTALRVTSLVFALITLINIRFIIKYWYDSRTANISVLLATTSFWFLSTAKIGAPFIMPAFWLSSLMALFAWSKYSKKPKLIKIMIALFTSLGLYSPSFIWWIMSVDAVLVFKFGLKNTLLKLKTPLILIPVAFLAPLIYASLDIDILKQLLGISNLTINPIKYASNALNYLSQFGIRGVLDPSINLGRLPYLDIFQLFMLAIGAVTIFAQRSLLKGKLLIITPLLFIALISIFAVNHTKLATLMPIVFIFITVGVNEFINLWLKGFPRNPIGRSLGLIIVTVLISMSGYYNVHRYFTAWAQNPDVKAAHQLNK